MLRLLLLILLALLLLALAWLHLAGLEAAFPDRLQLVKWVEAAGLLGPVLVIALTLLVFGSRFTRFPPSAGCSWRSSRSASRSGPPIPTAVSAGIARKSSAPW